MKFTLLLAAIMLSFCLAEGDLADAVVILTADTFQAQVLDSEKTVFVKFYAPWCSHCVKLAPTWSQLANELNNPNIVIAKVDLTQNKLPMLEIKGFPTLILFKNGQQVKYSGNRSYEDLLRFVNENAGVKPEVKAEPVKEEAPKQEEPEKVTSKVLVVTLDNYEEFVLNSQQDVLLEFYAPWCGHCKNLTPVYDELSLKVNNVIVAKVDATVHKLPGYEIKGYPTIKYLQKVNGKVETKDYTGARTLEGFLSFLNSQSKKQEDL